MRIMLPVRSLLTTTALSLVLMLGGCADNSTPEQHIAQAREYLNGGNVSAGIIELKNALQKDPQHAGARLLLGETYLRQGDGESAAKELARARELGIDTADLQLALYNALIAQGEGQKVLDELAAIPEDELSADLLAIRATAQLSLELSDDARDSYDQALALDSSSIESLLGLARMSLLSSDFTEANRFIDKALEKSPAEPRVWLLKGSSAQMSGDLAGAADAYREGLANASENPRLLIALIRVELGLEEYDSAKKHIAQLEKIRPGNIPGKYFRGFLAYKDQKNEEAKEYFRDVLSVNRTHPETLMLLSTILYGERQLERAAELINRYTEVVPSHVPALKLRAAIELSQNLPDKTIATLEPVLEQSAADAQILTLLGSAWMRKGDIAKGTELLEQAVAIDPKAANVRTQLALGRLANGETDLAVQELSTAIGIDSELVRADLILVLTRLRDKEFQPALKAAQALAEKRPDNPLPQNLMGAAYAGLEDKDSARLHFNKALQLQADFIPAKMNLAALELQATNISAGVKQYREILQQQEGHLEASLALATVLLKQNKEQEAVSVLKAASKANPNEVRPMLLLAGYHLQHDEFEQALNYARQSVEITPDNLRANQLLAEVLDRSGKPAEAEKVMTDLVARHPDHAELHNLIGRIYQERDKPALARSSYQRTLEIDPSHINAKASLAQLYLQEGKAAVARTLARELQDEHPLSDKGYLLEADIELHGRSLEKAIAVLDKGLSKVSSSAMLVHKARLQVASGDQENGISTMKSWLKSNPADAPVRMLLASYYQSNDMAEESIVEYEKLLQYDNTNVVALNNLAWLYQERSIDKAVEYAGQASRLAPQSPQITDTYGWLMLVKGGNDAEATRLLRKAHEAMPESAEIAYHLATALSRSAATRNEAVQLLNLALSGDEAFTGRDKAEALQKQLLQ